MYFHQIYKPRVKPFLFTISSFTNSLLSLFFNENRICQSIVQVELVVRLIAVPHHHVQVPVPIHVAQSN